jgi:hypothetical protein
MRNAHKKRRIESARPRLKRSIPPVKFMTLPFFELAIRAFDIQSGWIDAYERQRKYMRRDLYMGKLNPEKFSQRLQDLNRYLDFISIEKTSDNNKITKAYGK